MAKVARINRAEWTTQSGAAYVPLARCKGGLLHLPQNATEISALAPNRIVGHETLDGMVEPRVEGLAIDVMYSSDLNLLEKAIRDPTTDELTVIQLKLGTSDGNYELVSAKIDNMNASGSGQGNVESSIDVMGLKVLTASSFSQATASAGVVFMYYDGACHIGGTTASEIQAWTLRVANSLAFQTSWDPPAVAADARLPLSIGHAATETIEANFTVREKPFLIDAQAKSPGTTTASIKMDRNGSFSVEWIFTKMKLTDQELWSNPGGGDEIITYEIPLKGVPGSLAMTHSVG